MTELCFSDVIDVAVEVGEFCAGEWLSQHSRSASCRTGGVIQGAECPLRRGWTVPWWLLKTRRLEFHLFFFLFRGADKGFLCHPGIRGNLTKMVSVVGKVDVMVGQEPDWLTCAIAGGAGACNLIPSTPASCPRSLLRSALQ